MMQEPFNSSWVCGITPNGVKTRAIILDGRAIQIDATYAIPLEIILIEYANLARYSTPLHIVGEECEGYWDIDLFQQIPQKNSSSLQNRRQKKFGSTAILKQL
jgi:hypothetical protein